MQLFRIPAQRRIILLNKVPPDFIFGNARVPFVCTRRSAPARGWNVGVLCSKRTSGGGDHFSMVRCLRREVGLRSVVLLVCPVVAVDWRRCWFGGHAERMKRSAWLGWLWRSMWMADKIVGITVIRQSDAMSTKIAG